MPPVGREHLPLLTSLRFVAAAEVMTIHVVTGPRLDTLWFGSLVGSADLAVVFFFTLSGFIMTYVYSGAAEGDGRVDGRGFLKTRFARLAPAYYFALLLGLPDFIYMALASRILPLPDFLAGLVLVPTYLQSWWPPSATLWNAPAWSLCVEWAFYALFPWLLPLAAAVDRRRLLAGAFAAVVAVAAIKGLLAAGPAWVDPQVWGNFLYCFPLFHLPTFVLGMATARLFLFGRPLSLAAHKRLFFGAVAVLFLLLAARHHLPEAMTGAPVVVPLFCALILGGAKPGVCPPFMTSWLFVLLGEASYGLYILHEWILAWGARLARGLTLDLPPWGSVFLSFVFAVFVAVQFYLHVERSSVRRLRQRLAG